jgi:hypothetical protein
MSIRRCINPTLLTLLALAIFVTALLPGAPNPALLIATGFGVLGLGALEYWAGAHLDY